MTLLKKTEKSSVKFQQTCWHQKSRPFILNPVNREIKDLYNPQYPNLVDQKWIKLKPTKLGIKLRDDILGSFNYKKKPIFYNFPKKKVDKKER